MKDLFIGGVALCYAVWLLYAGGVKYLLLSALLYAPGVILFAQAKREQRQPLFTHVEKGIFACVMSGAGMAAYGLYSGFWNCEAYRDVEVSPVARGLCGSKACSRNRHLDF